MFYKQFQPFMLTSGHLDSPKFKAALLAGTFPDRKAFQPHIPMRLRRTIATCLDVNPTKRFQAAVDVANQLAKIESRLDWQFSSNHGTRTWLRNESGTIVTLRVAPDTSTVLTKALKSGKTQRVTAGCLKASNDKTLQSILEDHS